MVVAGTLVTTMDYGYIASVIQAPTGLMSVLCPNGLYDKDQVASGEGADNLLKV